MSHMKIISTGQGYILVHTGSNSISSQECDPRKYKVMFFFARSITYFDQYEIPVCIEFNGLSL